MSEQIQERRTYIHNLLNPKRWLRHEYPIRTKRKRWKVFLDADGVRFMVEGAVEGFFEDVQPHSIPTSIKRRARCFLKNPNLFGKRRLL